MLSSNGHPIVAIRGKVWWKDISSYNTAAWWCFGWKKGVRFPKAWFQVEQQKCFFSRGSQLVCIRVVSFKGKMFFLGGTTLAPFFPVLVHKVFFGVTGEPRGAPKIGGLGWISSAVYWIDFTQVDLLLCGVIVGNTFIYIRTYAHVYL